MMRKDDMHSHDLRQSIVYFFRVHEGEYGIPVYEALLGELIRREPAQSEGFRFHWGDYLPSHSFWRMRVQFEGDQERVAPSYDRVPSRVALAFYRDLLQSSSSSTIDSSLAEEMPHGDVWALAVANQYTSLTAMDEFLHQQLPTTFLGGLVLDPANPVHTALTFDTLPLYGFYRHGHLAVALDGDFDGEIQSRPPETDPDDLPWFASLGAETYSSAGYFAVERREGARLVMLQNGREISIDMPPAPLRAEPSKRGLQSLSLLLRGLTTYGADQLLTALSQLGESALEAPMTRWLHVPDFARADIDERKFRDYVLDPDHPKGQHKARVFLAALGFQREDSGLLAVRIREALLTNPTIQGVELTPYGVSWHLDLSIIGRNGATDVVRTAWQADYGVARPAPRLTSARLHRNQ